MKQVVLSLIGLVFLFAGSVLTDSYAQDKEYPTPPFEKRTCPVEADRERGGVVDSLYQVPYCWKRGEGLAGGVEILDSLKMGVGRHSYLFKIWPMGNGVKKDPENRFILSVEGKEKIHYHALPIRHSPGYDEVRLRAFRIVDVPEAKRKYLWTEFYEAYPKENEDTTRAYWTGSVHTFSSFDDPSLLPIDKYVSVRSPCAEETGPEPSIPVRHMKIVDGQTVEVSQIDVRFPRSGIAVITPRSDSLTEILQSWVGEYAVHSSLASEPISPVEGIISNTSGCDSED